MAASFWYPCVVGGVLRCWGSRTGALLEWHTRWFLVVLFFPCHQLYGGVSSGAGVLHWGYGGWGSVGAGVPEADVFLNGKLVTRTDGKVRELLPCYTLLVPCAYFAISTSFLKTGPSFFRCPSSCPLPLPGPLQASQDDVPPFSANFSLPVSSEQAILPFLFFPLPLLLPPASPGPLQAGQDDVRPVQTVGREAHYYSGTWLAWSWAQGC